MKTKSKKPASKKPAQKILRSLSAADLKEVNGGVVLLRSASNIPSGGGVILRSSGWSTLQSPSRITSSY